MTCRVLARWPRVKVIALTASVDEARMMGVLRAGALGYVRKDAEPEILLAAVRRVAAGKPYIDPGVGRQLVHAAPSPDDLTAREIDVLRQLALGRSNKDIATSLTIGEETVKTHVGHVLAKLQVENRAQAIIQALKPGLVTLQELERPRAEQAIGEVPQELLAPPAHAPCARMDAFGGSGIRIVDPPVGMRAERGAFARPAAGRP